MDLPGEYGVSATFNVADLSPYFDEHEETPSLRSNTNQAGENDGDHQANESNTIEKVKDIQRSVKEIREIYAMVRNTLTQNLSLLPSSIEYWPSVVHQLQQGKLGDFNGYLHPLQYEEVSFSIKKVSSHLEFIW